MTSFLAGAATLPSSRREGIVERLRHLVVIVPGIGGSVLAAEDEAVAWGKGLRTLASAVVSPVRI